MFGTGDILVEIFPPILVNNGPVGGLKEDVIFGIAGLEFFLNLLFQVVGSVLGLPITVGQPEIIEQGAVRASGFGRFSEGDIAPPG